MGHLSSIMAPEMGPRSTAGRRTEAAQTDLSTTVPCALLAWSSGNPCAAKLHSHVVRGEGRGTCCVQTGQQHQVPGLGG